MSKYRYSKELIADWEKKTGLKWDSKRADAFIELLGLKRGCDPYAEIGKLVNFYDAVCQVVERS